MSTAASTNLDVARQRLLVAVVGLAALHVFWLVFFLANARSTFVFELSPVQCFGLAGSASQAFLLVSLIVFSDRPDPICQRDLSNHGHTFTGLYMLAMLCSSYSRAGGGLLVDFLFAMCGAILFAGLPWVVFSVVGYVARQSGWRWCGPTTPSGANTTWTISSLAVITALFAGLLGLTHWIAANRAWLDDLAQDAGVVRSFLGFYYAFVALIAIGLLGMFTAAAVVGPRPYPALCVLVVGMAYLVGLDLSRALENAEASGWHAHLFAGAVALGVASSLGSLLVLRAVGLRIDRPAEP